MNYNRINDITGWVVFGIATFAYLSTIEPTTSFWDTGEYIATAYKLQVGHPPGAPFFQMLGRFFSMWVAPDKAAMMVNVMSALSSSFTILFLFWSITALTRKIALRTGELTDAKTFAVMGSGMVGALAYTFSDSFWFSAVEGEVYAMSSLFTAIVFWAILKWEARADEPGSVKWIILIAYLIGLSIGVHLLNLLAIPAIVFVYYFKKRTPTRNGFIITGIIAVVILAAIQNGIIPGIVSLAAKFELFFVNNLGMPFNSGTIFYFLLLIGLISWGLYYSHQKNKPIINTVILCFTVIVIGYSSFFLLIIRSNANTPIDENNPEDAITLLAYLNREQYGDWPLLYGQYYNAPLDRRNPYKDGNPVYRKDEAAGKYVITDDRKSSIPNYDPAFKTFFPRMHSSQGNHVAGYKSWGNIKGTPVRITNNRGEQETVQKPTFGENLTYFWNYQVRYMYWRYFMWNFVGRQNDTQGQVGNVTEGNWMSGIPIVDSIFLGSQEYPESMKRNKAMNHFFFLPLILGIIGLWFHFKRDPADGWVVFLLFFFTGIAIVLYLNQSPFQPRERDYAYAASFYAFTIWIGIGVYAIFDFLKDKIPANITAIATSLICLVFVPGIMAKEGWNDHDRSKRYTARDFAKNYLDSCAPNAIIFTNGDNDTFPLWYVQEVEGYRTDVRVVNLSLLNTDWYIDQMKRKAYDSEPVPFSLTEEKYMQGTRDYLPIVDRGIEGFTSVKDAIDFVASENPQTKLPMQTGRTLDYLPTNRFKVPVDKAKVLANGTVSRELEDQIVDNIEFQLNKTYVFKNEMMVLDLLAHNNWERPIYFAITTGSDAYMNLQEYFQLEGLAYRLVPVKQTSPDGQIGRVATEIMYDNLMNKFQWGGMDQNEIWMDENNLRMTMNFRNNFHRLADALLRSGDTLRSKATLDRALEVMPEKNVPYNFFIMYYADNYYKIGETEKANDLVRRLSQLYIDDIRYYSTLEDRYARTISRDIEQSIQIARQLMFMTVTNQQEELGNEIQEKLNLLPPAKSTFVMELRGRYFAGN
jgi:tetratricopeptide (TPR) repeat protein